VSSAQAKVASLIFDRYRGVERYGNWNRSHHQRR
jgi:hypothetical protein